MIRVQNIYYMLAYAFQALRQKMYQSLGTEKFDVLSDLMAAILIKGVSTLVKRGLGRGYQEKEEEMPVIRGRLALNETIRRNSLIRRQAVCSYDEFSEDILENQIIKAAMLSLLSLVTRPLLKKELQYLLIYFQHVSTVDLRRVQWQGIRMQRDQTYRMVLAVCQMWKDSLLQTETDGEKRLIVFTEDHMCHLYEKFILEYYKRHFPCLQARAAQIPWALDNSFQEWLPVMQSDIMLRRGDDILIIDAKYYSHTMQTRFGGERLWSHNLYQIFAYVKNQDADMKERDHRVSGMLLYAGTDENIQPSVSYSMSGNIIEARTLDMNCDFSHICDQLDTIASTFFPGVCRTG